MFNPESKRKRELSKNQNEKKPKKSEKIKLPATNIAGIILPERESVKTEEADNLPIMLIPVYQAFQKIGPEFTYTDLKNYLELRIQDSATWILYEKLLYSMKYAYNEFRNKEQDARMKKMDKKNKADK